MEGCLLMLRHWVHTHYALLVMSITTILNRIAAVVSCGSSSQLRDDFSSEDDMVGHSRHEPESRRPTAYVRISVRERW
ncbi:hypothetical protein CDL15_Pgr005680 [Punica granatum]|uniref:Uncharacterized protein n=1 Tax=Punica granatum TaxID=22663 RepID=A0A218WG33_PUNGR|nr:hypothetical protein CDL15_Pgr005680 [Punica granatum]